jgi:hypothetical protein
LLEPEETGNYTSFDFKKSRKLFEIGVEFTNQHIEELKQKLAENQSDSEKRKCLYQILIDDKISFESTF